MKLTAAEYLSLVRKKRKKRERVRKGEREGERLSEREINGGERGR